MGVIKDIVDRVIPNAQKRIDEGTNSKEALDIELKEIGYIRKKDVDGGKV